ncbi:MAG TPA: hypothetical protein VFF40_01895 [Acidimicrobiia bacterium]|nr:hypothetical protein [Acidimicrobiia bacterium]
MILGVLGAAVALVGCSGPKRSEPLTRGELTRRANAVCRRANDRIGRVATPDPLDSATSAEAFARVVSEQRAALRRLRALVPPEVDAADHERWLTQINLTLDLADESIEAIANDDPQAAIAANDRAEDIRVDADAFAVEYGITDCAQPTG